MKYQTAAPITQMPTENRLRDAAILLVLASLFTAAVFYFAGWL